MNSVSILVNDDSLRRHIAIAAACHLAIFLLMIAAEVLGLSGRAPLVDVSKTMEVSMVVLPKSNKAVPDRATRKPAAVAPVPPTTPVENTIPQPTVKQSDLTIIDEEAPTPVDHSDARADLMRQLDLQALLENAPEGTKDRTQTDPNSTSEEYINAGGVGLATDPEFARYVAKLKSLFMQNFAPLPTITDANPNISVTLKVTVDPNNGRVTGYSIKTSSNNASYDAAAERAVQAVPSVPLPPENYKDALNQGFDVLFIPPDR
jgi:TonB family protein